MAVDRTNSHLQLAVRDFCDALDCNPFLPGEWLDGFRNVIHSGQSSHDDDNSYLPQEEPAYSNYKKGAKAAESFLSCKLHYPHHSKSMKDMTPEERAFTRSLQ